MVFEPLDYKAAKKKLDAAGISVGCLASGIGLEKEMANDHRKFAAELKNAIKIAHEVGAKTLLHYGTELFTSGNPDFMKLKLYWQDAADLAASLGIEMVLENEPDDYTCTPERMLSIVEGMNSPAFKTNYDPTNYYHYQMNSQAFPYGYNLLKPYIGYVHIKNAVRYEPQFCPDKYWIGTPIRGREEKGDIYYTEADLGAVNIAGLLELLHKDGYEGICTPEPLHTTHERAYERLAHDVTYLRKTGYFTK